MLLLHGSGLVFLFCALHETIHRTAFASRRLNEAVSHLAGAVVMLGPEMFRAFHYAHHRYTQDPQRDPELSVKDVSTWSGYLLYLSGVSYWWRALKGMLVTAWGKVDAPYVGENKKALVIREARLYLLFYLALALGSWWLQSAALLWLWLLPVVLAQPLMRAYLLAEHTGCEFSGNMLANTRTLLSNPLVRFYAWNMPFHVEHHAYPGVPFHALRRVHGLIKEDIVNVSPGYLVFHWGWIRCLQKSLKSVVNRS
jgi:fatty acid desaturase